MNNRIYSSMSDGSFPDLYRTGVEENNRWCFFITILLSNCVFPGLLESYAIILSIRRDIGFDDWSSLVTPCVFCVTWTITEPLFREIVESRNSYTDTKRLSILGAVTTFIGVILNIITDKPLLHTFSYGFLGGLGTSLVLNQINYVIAETFESNIKTIRLIAHYGQAIGQCTLPYLFLIIFYYYGHYFSYLLIGGMVLQILPLTFFIKTNQIKQPQAKSTLLHYTRASSFNSDNKSLTNLSNDIPLQSLSKKNWKSPSDENLNMHQKEFEEDDEDDYLPTKTIDEDSEEKTKKEYGINILPLILEESEKESDEEVESSNFANHQKNNNNYSNSQKKLDDDIKRLSAISDQLDEIIINTENKEEISDKIVIVNETKNMQMAKRESINSIKILENNYQRKPCFLSYFCCIPFLKCGRSKRRLNNALIYTSNSVMNPLKLSITTWQFYPALLLKMCSLSIPFCFSSLIALLGNLINPKLHLTEVAFLLSVHGISWLSFLIFSPWLNRLPKSKYKYVSAFGSITSALGSFIILDSHQFEFIAIGSAITGIGYGAISVSCEETLRNCLGPRKWPLLRGILDILAGFLITLIALWMSILLTYTNGVEYCFGLLTAIFLISGLMWIMIPLTLSIRKHHDIGHMFPHI